MIVIFGTHVQKDNISNSVFQLFKIVFFLGGRSVRGVNGQKLTQNYRF